MGSIKNKFSYNKKKLSDLSYVIGSIIGDGCLTANKSITISSIDKEFLEAIRTKLFSFISYKKTPKIYFRKRIYVFNIYSSEFYRYVFDITKDKTIIPKFITNGDEKIIINFLSGLLDAEGGLNKKSNQIVFGQKSVQLTIDVFKLCKKLNLSLSSIKLNHHSNNYYFSINLLDFINIGGYFLIIRKQKILEYKSTKEKIKNVNNSVMNNNKIKSKSKNKLKDITTITVSLDTKKKLLLLKANNNFQRFNDLLNDMIKKYN